jgi:hypothetical protein
MDPPNYSGTKLQPAFDALMCAYNYYCGGGDTVTARLPRVKPGDVILMHAGVYKYHREHYTGDRKINATTPFEGKATAGCIETPNQAAHLRSSDRLFWVMLRRVRPKWSNLF